jgi:AcrR family transcriptional regulator
MVSKYLLMSSQILQNTENEGVSCRMHGDERRQQLLDVAMKVFASHGFRGTTTREIARVAGVSEAIIFRHFQNKEELYSAILDKKANDRVIPETFSKLARFVVEKDDFGFFYTLAISILENQKSDEDFLRLMLHSALEGHELADAFFEKLVLEVYGFVGEYIRERQADGDFIMTEPRVIARSFLGTIIHHSMNNLLWDKHQKILEISNEVAAKEFTELLLTGIRK